MVKAARRSKTKRSTASGRRKVLKPATPLEIAIELAVRRHTGHEDKAGAPYILHPLRVMMALRDTTERIAAVLHDVVEDTPTTLDDLRAENIPEEAVRLVDLLTKRPKQSKRAYYERLMPDPAARRIKLADLDDNLDVRRLRRVTTHDAERMERYRSWRVRLMEAEKEQTQTGG